MNPADIILIAVLAVILTVAVIITIRRKPRGSACCGDCAKCKGKCPSADR